MPYLLKTEPNKYSYDDLVRDGMFWVEHLLVQSACDAQRGMMDHV